MGSQFSSLLRNVRSVVPSVSGSSPSLNSAISRFAYASSSWVHLPLRGGGLGGAAGTAAAAARGGAGAPPQPVFAPALGCAALVVAAARRRRLRRRGRLDLGLLGRLVHQRAQVRERDLAATRNGRGRGRRAAECARGSLPGVSGAPHRRRPKRKKNSASGSARLPRHAAGEPPPMSVRARARRHGRHLIELDRPQERDGPEPDLLQLRIKGKLSLSSIFFFFFRWDNEALSAIAAKAQGSGNIIPYPSSGCHDFRLSQRRWVGAEPASAAATRGAEGHAP